MRSAVVVFLVTVLSLALCGSSSGQVPTRQDPYYYFRQPTPVIIQPTYQQQLWDQHNQMQQNMLMQQQLEQLRQPRPQTCTQIGSTTYCN